MAHKAPGRRRHQALREASFQVPHEVARLNSGTAPDFRLEDMGAVPSLPPAWEDIYKPKMSYPFDMNVEGRVFLYFPKGSAKATAAFVAINTEILPPEWSADQTFSIHKMSEQQEYFFRAALVGWSITWLTWAEHYPDVLKRIETGQLPVIFNFRERASGCLWDTRTESFINTDTASIFSSLNEPMVIKSMPG